MYIVIFIMLVSIAVDTMCSIIGTKYLNWSFMNLQGCKNDACKSRVAICSSVIGARVWIYNDC